MTVDVGALEVADDPTSCSFWSLSLGVTSNVLRLLVPLKRTCMPLDLQTFLNLSPVSWMYGTTMMMFLLLLLVVLLWFVWVELLLWLLSWLSWLFLWITCWRWLSAQFGNWQAFRASGYVEVPGPKLPGWMRLFWSYVLMCCIHFVWLL